MTFPSSKVQRGALALLAGASTLWAAPALAQRGQYPSGAVVQPLPDQGRGAELRSHLRTLAENPRSLSALVGAGRAAVAAGDYQAALTFFNRAREVSPGDARALAGLGSVLIHMEQPQEALGYFTQARAAGAPEAEVAGDRGLAYDAVGDQARAQADYNLALRNRDDPEIRRRLALSLAISGQRDAALRTIADQLARQDRAAFRVRTFILALTGDAAGASQSAQAAMPAGAAASLAPFLARLPALAPAQRAMAVHFGRFPTGQQLQIASNIPQRQLPPQAQPQPSTRRAPAASQPQPRREQRSSSPAQSQPTPRPSSERAPLVAEERVRRRRSSDEPLGVTRPSAPERRAQRVQQPPPAQRQQQPTPSVAAPPAASQERRGSAAQRTVTPQPQREQPVEIAQAPPQSQPVQQVPVPQAQPQTPSQEPQPQVAQLQPSQPVQIAEAQPQPQIGTGAQPQASGSTQPQAPVAVAQLPPSTAAETPEPQLPGFTLQPGANPAPAAQTPAPVVAGTQPPQTPPAPSPARPGFDEVAALVSRLPTEERPSTRAPQTPRPQPQSQTPPRVQRAPATAPAPRAERPTTATRPAGRTEPQAGRTERPGAPAGRDRTAAAEPRTTTASQRNQRQQPAREPHPSRHWVQVAGGADRTTLPREYARLRERAPALLRNRTPYVTPLRATNRLLVGPFPSVEAAQEFVNELARANLTAFAWTSPAGQEIERLPTQ